MGYKFQNELLQAAEELIRMLKHEDILADVIHDSFRDYTMKVSVSRNGKSFGNVNLYYSPKKDLYSFRTHELRDKSVASALEKCWQQLFAESNNADHSGYQIYVDGSFLNGAVGYGVVILRNNEIIKELFGLVPPVFVQGTHQVAGELFAIEKALEWCQKNSIGQVPIFYDYKGIEKWASGEWKAKQPLTQEYVRLVRNCGINICWHKVNSHTGDRWNERADELAKRGAGSASSKQEDSNLDLENKANGFIQFLKDRGYEAKLKGLYDNSSCAKIQVSAANMDIGYVNIYCTKKVPFLPKYHELKNKFYEDKLDLLWQEYHYGERLLPFQ